VADQGAVNVTVAPNVPTPLQSSLLGDANPTPIFFTLATHGTLAQGVVDTFTKGQSYNLDLTLTDKKSGATGTAHFVGVLAGSVSSTTNPFTTSFATTSATLHLGNFDYVLSVLNAQGKVNFTPPGPAGLTAPGNIMVGVTVEPFTGTPPGPTGQDAGPPSPSPEPSTLALAGMGVFALGLVRRQRRKKELASLSGASA
jgi:hypothetical protein